MRVIVGSARTLGVVAVAVTGLAMVGRSQCAMATQALLGQVEAARLPSGVSHYDVRELEGLPDPVQRYFRAALKEGQSIVTGVTVRHTESFDVTALGTREVWMSEVGPRTTMTHTAASTISPEESQR